MPDCTECERLKGVIEEKKKEISDLEQEITEYEIKIKRLNDQKVKEKEETEKIIGDLRKEINQLKKEIEELKIKLARMDSLENKMKANETSLRKEIEEMKTTITENEESHNQEMEKMKAGYKDDMRKLEESNVTRIQELNEKMEEYHEVCKWNEDENHNLKEENRKLEKSSKDYEKLIQDQYKLYLGQICVELQDNLYRHIIPNDHCTINWNYKIKDIEEDIKDKDLLNDEERREATERLEEVKKRINWDDLKKLIGTIKQLQYQRNDVAHPPDVDESIVRHAAQELEKRGQLRGRSSIDKVMQVIEIWSVSKSLLSR